MIEVTEQSIFIACILS